VEAVREGASLREAGARYGAGIGTVTRALARAGDRPLEEVDWADRSTAPLRTRRTAAGIEQRVVALRDELGESDLGDVGAVAIRARLLALGEPAPSVRTIGRILVRAGKVRRQRKRNPAPPLGWYVPEVAAGAAELDSFDAIVDLPIPGGHMDVLTGISLHGGDPDAWPGLSVTAASTCRALLERWERTGRPAMAQWDNDTRFLGSHGQPDVLGRVPLLLLEAGVVPVYAPLGEVGFQNAIEGFNALWQRRTWRRHKGADLAAVVEHSRQFVTALRLHRMARIEAAPARRPLASPILAGWQRRIVFVRRTDATGAFSLLGRQYTVGRDWPHRFLRAELMLDERLIRCFGLRRRDPTNQPLLGELPYEIPARRSWVFRMYRHSK
jgi:hypothetical protein